ncbi:MAG: hypothetical protein ACR2G2_07825 [Pseudonocardia sp.]
MTGSSRWLTRRAVLRAITAGGALAASTAVVGCTSKHPQAAPGTLAMIIRHGEKQDKSSPLPGIGENGNPDPNSLTQVGYARAHNLAVLFDPTPGPLRPGLARPKVIYAASAHEGGEGARTRETVAPLAQRLGIAVNTSFGKGDEDALAAAIISEPGPTLVCWHHGEIPAIAEAFGQVSPAPPSNWPDDRFDVIWTVTAAGAGWNFAQIPEMVLPGDPTTTIAG